MAQRLGSRETENLKDVNGTKVEEIKTALEEIHLPPLGPPPPPPPPPSPPPPPPPTFDPVERIVKGFNRFRTHEFERYADYFEGLAKVQKPKFLVFACSDSRVGPSRILDFPPGEAFVARGIANLVPASDKSRYSGTGAVIEYAVAALEVKVILVIGHSRCGGIRALMELIPGAEPNNDFIDDWIKIGLPAKEKVLEKLPGATLEEQCMMCEREAVNFSLENLLSYPYVRDRVENRTLKLMGAHYDFVTGRFQLWGPHMPIMTIDH